MITQPCNSESEWLQATHFSVYVTVVHSESGEWGVRLKEERECPTDLLTTIPAAEVALGRVVPQLETPPLPQTAADSNYRYLRLLR